LDLWACLDCGLIQVADPIPPGYYTHYVYVPSASPTMRTHFGGLARVVAERLLGGRPGLAVDIGSNDGLLLKSMHDLGARTVGIEPAANLCATARQRGLEVVNDYFTPAAARAVRSQHGPAKAITSTNTFNSIDDLHTFMEGVAHMLDDAGTFVIEVPHAL